MTIRRFQLTLAIIGSMSFGTHGFGDMVAQSDEKERLAGEVAKALTADGSSLLSKWDNEVIVAVAGEVIKAKFRNPEYLASYSQPPSNNQRSWPRREVSISFDTASGPNYLNVAYEVPAETDPARQAIERDVAALRNAGVPIRLASTDQDHSEASVEMFILRRHTRPIRIIDALTFAKLSFPAGELTTVDAGVEYVPLLLHRISEATTSGDAGVSSRAREKPIEWEQLSSDSDCSPKMVRRVTRDSRLIRYQVVIGECATQNNVEDIVADSLFEAVGLGVLNRDAELRPKRLAWATLVYESGARSGMDMRAFRGLLLKHLLNQ